MTQDEYIDYLGAVYHRFRDPELAERFGQAAFNVLSHRHPHIADQILATELDSFYDDSKTANLFAYLATTVDR